MSVAGGSAVVPRTIADPLQLASWVQNVASEKWDRTLPRELLWTEYAQKRLDPFGAWTFYTTCR